MPPPPKIDITTLDPLLPELKAHILNLLLSSTSTPLLYTLIRTCRKYYDSHLRILYRSARLSAANADDFFFGIGFDGRDRRPGQKLLSGFSGLDLGPRNDAAAAAAGAALPPLSKMSAYIRKNVLLGCTEKLVIADLEAFNNLIQALDTWRPPYMSGDGPPSVTQMFGLNRTSLGTRIFSKLKWLVFEEQLLADLAASTGDEMEMLEETSGAFPGVNLCLRFSPGADSSESVSVMQMASLLVRGDQMESRNSRLVLHGLDPVDCCVFFRVPKRLDVYMKPRKPGKKPRGGRPGGKWMDKNYDAQAMLFPKWIVSMAEHRSVPWSDPEELNLYRDGISKASKKTFARVKDINPYGKDNWGGVMRLHEGGDAVLVCEGCGRR
ncbi:hypothetical protein IAT38_005231 [Cryptococcus sp. DSM 104549]